VSHSSHYFFPNCGHNNWEYSFCLPTEWWPGYQVTQSVRLSIGQSFRWSIGENLMWCRVHTPRAIDTVYTIVVEETQHQEKCNVFRCHHKGSRYGTALTSHGSTFWNWVEATGKARLSDVQYHVTGTTKATVNADCSLSLKQQLDTGIKLCCIYWTLTARVLLQGAGKNPIAFSEHCTSTTNTEKKTPGNSLSGHWTDLIHAKNTTHTNFLKTCLTSRKIN